MAGERVTEWFKLPVTSPVGQALLGVLLISLLAQIPCLGPLAAFLVASAGIGAVVLTRFGAMTHPAPGTPAEAGASPAPVAPGSGPAPKPRGGTRPLDPFAAPDDTEGPH
jgi:hypothetical protein